MLRKRTRSDQKDNPMLGRLKSDVVASETSFQTDFLAHKHKNTSFFNIPGLFVGFNAKSSSECDSVRSPTSPLDFRVFSNLGNPFRSPRSPSHEGNHRQKSWDSDKVGLSIVDSLDHEVVNSGKVLRASDSKNILFGPQVRIKIPYSHKYTASFEAPKSLPKGVGIFPFANSKPSNLRKEGNASSDVLFHIGDDAPFVPCSNGKFRPCSLDSGRSVSHLSRFANHGLNPGGRRGCDLENGKDPASVANGVIGTIPPPHEIEMSEDYTCVRKHGPNPRVTHIFGDCILECHNNGFTDIDKNNTNKDGDEAALADQAHTAPECSKVVPVPPIASYPSSDFLSLCYSCQKKLDGEDIYMYRGEKAFCSWNCRLQEIMIDEEMEKGSESSNAASLESSTTTATTEARSSNAEELPATTGMFIFS